MMESRIRRLATTLMDATTDADPEVQEQIRESLCALGEAEPEEILNSCQEYLQQHDKLPYPHRALILRAMERVIGNHIHELGKGAAAAAVALASHEMTKSKDSLPEWQGAASAVLVSVGRRFLNKVMEEVLGKFQPGILPHPFVLRTFGDLASANVFGMVPFLNSILGTLLPMLGMARADSMKIEFCYALQRFGESVQEYLADPERAPDPTIRGDSFGHEFGAAFELLLGAWLPHREHKVRQAAVAALGPMSALIPKEKLEEQLPKILPGILGLFRKQPEPFPVSKSLCQLLESAVAIGSRSLESQLESLLAALLPQICSPADPEAPTSARNRTELLRCFSVLARAFPERVLEFLLPRLESGNEKIRAGSILVLRHVINSAPSQMEMKKSFILSSMKLPLHDGNTEVRRALVQLVSALALHGFLEPPGGEALLHFLVRQCALPAPTTLGIPEADSLRSISVDTLLLLSTTVDGVSHVLWPFLLGFLLPPEFSTALTPLCRSLTFLAAKIREEQRENGPESHGNVPSPHALTARLLAVSSQPFPEGRGSAALRLLRELCPHRALGPLWDTEIPVLLDILRENTEDSLCQQEWEERLLQFLQKSLDSIPDKAWICSLISEISRQLGASDGSQPEKSFLYRCMGTALGACPSKDTVRKELQELLESARYHQEEEREGLAWCFGICARSHLEETLEKLEEFVRSDVFRKSLGLFSLFKERSEAEQERLRSALVLCWGRVAEAAPPEVLSSRLESLVLRNLLQHGHTKDTALKLSLIRSVAMISRALAPRDSGNSGNSPGNSSGNDPGNSPGNSVGIARKAELVALMVEFLRAEPAESLGTRLRQRALGACALLVALEPPLADPERAELLDTALGSVLGLPPLEFGKSREEPGNEPGQDLLGDALGALTELLRSLLRRRLTPHGLQEIFAHLGPWIKSPREQERQRAMAVSSSLLEFYLEKLHVSSVTPFHNLSLLLALLSPRCSDGIPKIRRDAVDCVRSLLYIQLCYQGFSREHRDELLEELRALAEGLGAPDVAVLFHTCTRLASVIGRRIPPEQLPSLLLELFQGLEDPEGNCSRAAAAILNALLKERGGILQEKVPELLLAARARLAARGEEHAWAAARQAVLLLGLRHPQRVVATLLASPLPFDGATRAMWRALGAEAALAAQVLEQLLELLSREVPFKESRAFLLGSSAERVATPLALAATCALDELTSVPEAAAAVLELFPSLFPALLLRLASSVGVRGPRAARGGDRSSVQPCRISRNFPIPDPCLALPLALNKQGELRGDLPDSSGGFLGKTWEFPVGNVPWCLLRLLSFPSPCVFPLALEESWNGSHGIPEAFPGCPWRNPRDCPQIPQGRGQIPVGISGMNPTGNMWDKSQWEYLAQIPVGIFELRRGDAEGGAVPRRERRRRAEGGKRRGLGTDGNSRAAPRRNRPPGRGDGRAVWAADPADRAEPHPRPGQRFRVPESHQRCLPGRAPQPQRGERPGPAGAAPGRADGAGEGSVPPGARPGAPGAREHRLGIPGKGAEARRAAAGLHGERPGRQGRPAERGGAGGHGQPGQAAGAAAGAGRALGAAARGHPHPPLLRQRAGGAAALLHRALREPGALGALRLRGLLGADPPRARDAAAAPAGPLPRRRQGVQVRPADVRAQRGLRGAAGDVWESPAGGAGAALRRVPQRRLQVPDAQPPVPAEPSDLHQPLLLQEPLEGAARGSSHVHRIPGAARG